MDSPTDVAAVELRIEMVEGRISMDSAIAIFGYDEVIRVLGMEN